MSDGKQNERPVKNSLLSGASGNYLFEDFGSETMLVPVPEPTTALLNSEEASNQPRESAPPISEIDLNSDDFGRRSSFTSFIPPDMPHVSSNMFQSPPTSSSVHLFRQDHGPYTPTQAITSPVLSAENFTISSTPISPFSAACVSETNPIYSDDGKSITSSIMDAFSTVVDTLTSGYASFAGTGSERYPMNLQQSNTSTTFNAGKTEITNVVPSSYVSSARPQEFPEIPAAPSTAQLASSTSGASNNFRLSSQKPVYAQYPGLVNSSSSILPSPFLPPPPANLPPSGSQSTVSTFVPPAASGSSVTSSTENFLPELLASLSVPTAPPTENANVLRPLHSPPNPAYVNAYSVAKEYGSAYNFGSPVPPNQTHFSTDNRLVYQPVAYHWFCKMKESEGRLTWRPYSLRDSVALEEACISQNDNPVATDGGRYDVYVSERLRKAVYWDEDPTEVRRASWFYKGPLDSRFIPYDEEFSSRLEEEYYNLMSSGVWHKRLEFADGEAIVFHNAGVIVHFCKAAAPDEWGSVPESQLRPRVVKRGVPEDIEIQDGESSKIDHLVFLVHGIGAICDFKFRDISEAVDGFRSMSFSIMQSHFKEAIEAGMAGRIEFLPVSWHKALHGEGEVDEQLKKLTLPSIPKLRHFTNDTLLDILFYTSPKYCQTITKTVGTEMNKLYNLFTSRNPDFNGKMAVGGHSLGALIVFDLLYHQPGPDTKTTIVDTVDSTQNFISQSPINIIPGSSALENLTFKARDVVVPDPNSSPRMVSFNLGAAGTGQPFIVYPILDFKPTAFFAMGSPTAMFVTVRGLEKLAEDFHLPTCPAYFNIFHPYDPVAYRIEPLIVENFDPEPVLIPHHKGRKRFHRELKDNLMRIGTGIKTKLVDSVLSTVNAVYSFGYKKYETKTTETDNMVTEEKPDAPETNATKAGFASRLNKGRRIDYVLQEAPVETINEYLFALSSHVCYWESEDTMLMIMKEIYNSLGVQEDSNFRDNTLHPNGSYGEIEMDPMYIGPAAKVLMKEECSESPSPQNSLTSTSSRLTSSLPVASLNRMSSTPPAPLGNDNLVFDPPVFTQSSMTPPLLIQSLAVNSFPISPPLANGMSQSPFSPSPIPSAPGNVANIGSYAMGMDPTAPPTNSNIGPPPLAGFQRRT